ncbi:MULTISPECIES: glucose-6-phosphate isomerase [Rhizobium]|uniref:Glucose-6-phosphate isomerase n=1 Tax=Rhizobium changzhiense TaxID=2692317 RepID=A0A7Z0UHS0_9HYPH|nr:MULTISPECIES: glucose-6-phosphate isomerase [Rhizobium]MBA5800492.1 glucose-6-phosphate isomerase [Rhizobium changzhiense]MCW0019114.1 glucose-6-phosphate isomerase [Rhizobium sp. BT-226]NZD66020.1 glucose-6-phosphate isomerase [Rhizobium changzhiense]
MALFEPGIGYVDIAAGQLKGATNRYMKTFRDLEGLYEDAEAFAAIVAARGDEVAYEVTDYKPSANAGDIIIGVTRMEPGKVGREYYMTRGHIHARPNRPEMYYGESGLGVMLLESPAGDIRTIEIGPKAMCYVPPFWIHRSVNVGSEPLVMTFAYPADSGQDYDVIAKAGGMKSRIVDDGKGGWKAIDNTAYLARPQALIDSIMARLD